MSCSLSRDFALVIVGIRDLSDGELLLVASTSGLKVYPVVYTDIVIGAEEAISSAGPGVLERVGITVRILRDNPLRVHQRDDMPANQDSCLTFWLGWFACDG
jgi:hypothetical protein